MVKKFRCCDSSCNFYEQPDGEWVDSDDYDALAARLAEVQALLRGVAKDATRYKAQLAEAERWVRILVDDHRQAPRARQWLAVSTSAMPHLSCAPSSDANSGESDDKYSTGSATGDTNSEANRLTVQPPAAQEWYHCDEPGCDEMHLRPTSKPGVSHD